MERCFLCHRKMDKKTGLCTNKKCIRSKPLKEKPENKTEDNNEYGGHKSGSTGENCPD